MIRKRKISEIIEKITLGYNPDKIILFGSYASGKADENSDIDLLVIKESDLPRPERTVKVRRMLFGMNVPIDLIVYTPEEVSASRENPFSFIYEVLKSGKTIYERGV